MPSSKPEHRRGKQVGRLQKEDEIFEQEGITLLESVDRITAIDDFGPSFHTEDTIVGDRSQST